MELREELVLLLKKTATQLPEDIIVGLEEAEKIEENSITKKVLQVILLNVKQANQELKPICQDTGTPIFYVKYPTNFSQTQLEKTIQEAVDIATKEILLRPNSVDCLTGKNVGNIPAIHFEQANELKIELMLKGGGSENVSAIYSLPNQELNAYRDLNGVKKCVLDAVFKAQGKGCPPYIVGVALGGSIEEAAHLSKKQLLRKIGDKNPIQELQVLEEKTLNELNQLGIGALGFGGKTTALAVKVGSGLRHPASFFVGVSVGCWCLRRQEL